MRANSFLPTLCLLLVGLVSLPISISAAAEPTKEELKTAAKNLKSIGIAFYDYGEANDNKWADDITDKDGRILLSWRVAILPYLKEEKLYKEFKLDEPWDSTHNKKLIAKMPKVYAPVRVKAKPGETFYQRFVGKDALFAENGSEYKIGNIPDGHSNTALVVEAGDPVIWTKPADLPFLGIKPPLPKLGGQFDGDFHVLLCDGDVTRFKKNYDPDEMKKVIMPADGISINFDKLRK